MVRVCTEKIVENKQTNKQSQDRRSEALRVRAREAVVIAKVEEPVLERVTAAG